MARRGKLVLPSRRNAVFFNRPPARHGARSVAGSTPRRVSAEPKTPSQAALARRRGAMIALAVAVGSPANLLLTAARAATPAQGGDETYRPAAAPRPFIGVVPAFLPEQPKASDSDLLKQGVDQFSKGRHGEALATLQQGKAGA